MPHHASFSVRSNARLRTSVSRLLNILVVFTLVMPTLNYRSPQTPKNGQTEQKLFEQTVAKSNPASYQRPVIVRPQPRIGARPQPGMEMKSAAQGFLHRSPLMFIENRGQFDSQAEFVVQGMAGNVILAQDAIWVTLLEPEATPGADMGVAPLPTPSPNSDATGNITARSRKGVHLRFQFIGANRYPEIEGFDPLDTTVSYFLGNDASQWQPDVPVWGGIRYIDVYPGVDLEITGAESQWSWRVVVQDAERFTREGNLIGLSGIRLQVEGGQELTYAGNSIRVRTDLGEVVLPELPVMVRDVPTPEIQSESTVVAGNEWMIFSPDQQSRLAATLTQDMETSSNDLFSLWSSPATQSTLDSTSSMTTTEGIIFSTYLGGNYQDLGTGIEVDSTGSVYVTGWAVSTSFPTTPGAFQETNAGIADVFVIKLNETGNQLVYSTYLGGSNDDFGYSIAVDGSGAAYITGLTYSINFPVNTWDMSYSNSDAFVTKISPDGMALQYSTYLGGTNGEHGFGIAVNSNGEAHVVGQTASFDFPVTLGSYDVNFNGGSWDGFVTKLRADGSGPVFSTFLGGNGHDCEIGGNELECSVAVSVDGHVYVAGPTYSSNFPTTAGAFDTTYNGGEDAFVLKLTPDGSNLVYSTYLGGSGDDCYRTCAIAVDSFGSAYVTGSTTSTDFPGAAGSYGGWDIFLVKLSPDGASLGYSLRLGGSNEDLGYGVDVDGDGQAYLIGYSASPDFPVTPEAFQQTLRGPRDAYIVELNSTGSEMIYSTFLGGDSDEIGYDLAVDEERSIYAVGWTNSGNFPTTPGTYQSVGGNDAFVAKIGAYPVVNEPSTLNGCDENRECPAILSQTQGYSGDPINTRTGAYFETFEDLSIPTSAGELSFLRTYSSLATDLYTTTLGYGWTHNHDTRLIFPGDPGGQEGFVLFKAHSANQYPFVDKGDGTYTAGPGVVSSLVLDAGLFKLTDPAQRVYTFDGQGRLLNWEDAQGHGWTYTYTAGQLDLISDDTGQRYLDFDYDLQSRLVRVADHTGRDVAFGYDAAGDLATFTDVMDHVWTYTYTGQHQMRVITDPDSAIVVRTEYDPQGRAYQQYDSAGELTLQVAYNDGLNLITDALGNQVTHAYSYRNILKSQLDGQGGASEKTYDLNFRPATLTDAIQNTTQLQWSPDGANLAQVIDANGGQTDMSYDNLNNLTAIVDPLGYLTTYDYDGTQLIRSTDALSNTMIYTYTSAIDYPQPAGLLKAERDPMGRVTSYAYDEFGQRISVTDAAVRATTFAYDTLGRLIEVVYPNGKINWTCYDAAGRVIRSVENASGDGSAPQTDPCDSLNYQPSSDPSYDRTTTTIYDLHGNLIATVDPNGLVSRTYFDTNNRPVTVVQNLVGQAIEAPTPPTYNPSLPDQNVRTDTVYDAAGNVIAAIDTLGRITRNYYDTLNRLQYVVNNLFGQSIEALTPPAYDPNFPDRNVRFETVYDPAGNVIAAIDPVGRITRTYYDALNRPLTVVQNLVGQAIEVSTPPAYDPQYPDRNVRKETVYDEAGNGLATIDTLGRVTRTYYDALNRAETVVQNLSGQSIEVATSPDFNPAYPDQNVRTDYVYDPGGALIATVDPNGVVTRTYYDAYGRPWAVVHNLVGQAIEYSVPPAYDPDYPDQNVRTETVYDADGNPIAAVDPLGHITRTYYDELDRPYLIVRNLVGQAIENPTPPAYNPAYHDQNVRSETVYDADGRTVATIANDGSISRTYYDVLGRAWLVVRNLTGQAIDAPVPPVYDPDHPDQNVRSETVYGPGGSVQQVVDPEGRAAYTCYDGLYRAVTVIVNPTVANPCEVYTPSAEADLDILTSTAYDAAGLRLATTDPNGKITTFQYDELGRLKSEIDPLNHAVGYEYDGAGRHVGQTDPKGVFTRFEYDGLGRLAAVIENYRPGFTPDNEINMRTEYTYDAVGNRDTVKDALNHVTHFAYDDLGRLLSESDALDHTTTYGYDSTGNRVSLLDANGFTTTFAYDGLNRLSAIDYPAPDGDVSFAYDAAGNRTSMSDGVGSTSWGYDGLNRPTAITDPFNGIVQYGYDATGSRTSLTYPDNKSVVYDYDRAGRLQMVTGWDALETGYAYDKGGRLQSTTLPNGVTSTYDYRDDGRLVSLTHQLGGQALASFEYEYDAAGNRSRAYDNQQATFLHHTGLASPTASLAEADGDGNGFESDPSNALSDDGLFAVDLSSGTNSSTDCLDAGKDKHQFYDFGLSVPAEAEIQGIVVRLDAKADSTRNSPQMCVQLSWDGGSSWSSAQTTPSLTTSETTYLLGGALDTWGHTWTGTQLDDANLRVRVINIASSKNRDFSLDWIAVEVAYLAPPTITYTYDPLNRLTAADYSYGDYFHYSYDAVGNRLSEITASGTTTYTYDSANRLTYVNGEPYTWDDNGNLLNDGVYTYSYDSANRLIEVNWQGGAVSYAYNGQGDRLQQTVGITTTNYTLDLAVGLTQVLDDGTYNYLYGNGRIAQHDAAGLQYFHGDALGSVRLLTDGNGSVTLSRSYQPYGDVMASAGDSTSAYGFTNEYTSQGLIYLRSRWYSPHYGRFMTKDVWPGNYQRPLSLNPWNYVESNPVNLTDPSGKVPECDRFKRADLTQWLVDELNTNRDGWIAGIIRVAIQQSHIDEDNPFNGELGATAVAYLTFYDTVKTHGLWDFKWRIREKIGRDIRLAGRWYRYDVPANINFGYLGLAVGFDGRTLHCGADFATNRQWCSGADPYEDHEAIEAGYDIWKLTRGMAVDENILHVALARHPLIAKGIENEPNPESIRLPWPYPVGTFDDGTSGWWITSRYWWRWE